jgi:hypothetical protein
MADLSVRQRDLKRFEDIKMLAKETVLAEAPKPPTAALIQRVCREIEALLLEKNRKYGDSALNPIRIFSREDALAQINVRIDDKLSRIANQQPDEDEDVDLDLIGYLVLRRIAKIKAQ